MELKRVVVFFPFVKFLEASIYTLLKRYDRAINSYDKCISESGSRFKKSLDKNSLRQLAINRDYCIVGIARTYFAKGEYEKANSAYLDLKKNSYIWPEILFEEAWTSFYLRNYNRTLGKLVTYKAPVLSYYYNPEIDVLGALTYLEMCLWGDAKKTVDNFYAEYYADSKDIDSFLRKEDVIIKNTTSLLKML